MKIQKVPADNKDAVVFAVNNADYSAGEGRASISLPSTIFKGQGRVQMLFGTIIYLFFLERLCNTVKFR